MSWGVLLPAVGLVFLAMIGAWVWQKRSRNAGIVDLVWTLGVGGLALAYAALAHGWSGRRWLIAVLAGTWCLRLALHLARRLRTEPEDGRYARMRSELGSRFDAWMLAFFLAQAALATLLSTAMLIPCMAEERGYALRDGLAVLLWACALGGESLADFQLRVWRSAPENKGRTCRSGLWRYSRHPNYFFEWVHWLAYPVIAIGLPYGWAAWFAPALMLMLVLKVTGIPVTERHSLASRGADYREYQQTTNAFVPGPTRPIPRNLPNPAP